MPVDDRLGPMRSHTWIEFKDKQLSQRFIFFMHEQDYINTITAISIAWTRRESGNSNIGEIAAQCAMDTQAGIDLLEIPNVELFN